MTAPKISNVIYHQGQKDQKYIHASVVEELVKALELYGNGYYWEGGGVSDENHIEIDFGQIAQQALNNYKTKVTK